MEPLPNSLPELSEDHDKATVIAFKKLFVLLKNMPREPIVH